MNSDVMTEKIIETQILRWLNFQSQVFAFKINTVGVYDSKREVYRVNRNPFLIKGTADILGVAYGRFIAIEVKTPKAIKNVSLNQKAFLDKVNQNDGHAIAVSSLAEVIAFIENIKQKYLLEP